MRKFVCLTGFEALTGSASTGSAFNLGLRPCASCLREAGGGWELAGAGSRRSGRLCIWALPAQRLPPRPPVCAFVPAFAWVWFVCCWPSAFVSPHGLHVQPPCPGRAPCRAGPSHPGLSTALPAVWPKRLYQVPHQSQPPLVRALRDCLVSGSLRPLNGDSQGPCPS